MADALPWRFSAIPINIEGHHEPATEHEESSDVSSGLRGAGVARLDERVGGDEAARGGRGPCPERPWTLGAGRVAPAEVRAQDSPEIGVNQ